MQGKAQSAAQRNEATLAAKKEEAQAIGRDAHEKIAAEINAARAAAEHKFAQELAAAEARIAAEKADAMSHVESIASEAAASIVAKLTGAAPEAHAVAAAYESATAG